MAADRTTTVAPSAGPRPRPWSLVLWATAVITVVALLSASWSSWNGVRAAQDALDRAQAEATAHAVHSLLRELPGPPSGEDLAAALADGAADGLRGLALVTRDGRVVASAGSLTLDASSLPLSGGMRVRRVGSLVHAVAGPPVRPDRAPRSSPPGGPVGGRPAVDPFDPFDSPPPPPRDGDADGRGRPGRRPAEPSLVLELEPVLAAGLQARATLALVLGSLAAAILLGGALLAGRLLAARDAAEARLAQQRRLAELGGMSALIAHELRNPLASLKGHAQLLAAKLPEGDAARKAERVVTEARRLEALAESLLDFARAGRVDVRDAEPAALLREAADEAGGDRVVVDVAACPPRWRLDPIRVRQALANIIDNAVQASPGGAVVEASARRDGDSLVLSVRDRGAGLPEDMLERIFEPFVTTRTNGTGLGLAVTRRIAELHGGRVVARNHPGGGALFELVIPS